MGRPIGDRDPYHFIVEECQVSSSQESYLSRCCFAGMEGADTGVEGADTGGGSSELSQSSAYFDTPPTPLVFVSVTESSGDMMNTAEMIAHGEAPPGGGVERVHDDTASSAAREEGDVFVGDDGEAVDLGIGGGLGFDDENSKLVKYNSLNSPEMSKSGKRISGESEKIESSRGKKCKLDFSTEVVELDSRVEEGVVILVNVGEEGDVFVGDDGEAVDLGIGGGLGFDDENSKLVKSNSLNSPEMSKSGKRISGESEKIESSRGKKCKLDFSTEVVELDSHVDDGEAVDLGIGGGLGFDGENSKLVKSNSLNSPEMSKSSKKISGESEKIESSRGKKCKLDFSTEVVELDSRVEEEIVNLVNVGDDENENNCLETCEVVRIPTTANIFDDNKTPVTRVLPKSIVDDDNNKCRHVGSSVQNLNNQIESERKTPVTRVLPKTITGQVETERDKLMVETGRMNIDEDDDDKCESEDYNENSKEAEEAEDCVCNKKIVDKYIGSISRATRSIDDISIHKHTWEEQLLNDGGDKVEAEGVRNRSFATVLKALKILSSREHRGSI